MLPFTNFEVAGRSVRADLRRWNTEPLREQVDRTCVRPFDLASLDARDLLRAQAREVAPSDPLLEPKSAQRAAEGAVRFELAALRPPAIVGVDFVEDRVRRGLVLAQPHSLAEVDDLEPRENEIFLGLVAQDGKTPAKVPRGFRWVLGEYLDLPVLDFAAVGNGMERRRLQPDAMLEDPKGKRRYFIEYETGSATVRDGKKSTSTLAKIDRYGTFYRTPAGNVFAGERETGYTRAFKDGWPAEVLFVTQSDARRDSINALIQERNYGDKYKIDARALTLAEAHRFLCRALYGADRPPPIVRRTGQTPKPVTLASPLGHSADTPPPRSATEERLRPGRVAVRGEQLVNFEKLLRASLSAMTQAQEALTRMRAPLEVIPKLPANASSTLRVLAEYARRGEEALSRHGLTEAV